MGVQPRKVGVCDAGRRAPCFLQRLAGATNGLFGALPAGSGLIAGGFGLFVGGDVGELGAVNRAQGRGLLVEDSHQFAVAVQFCFLPALLDVGQSLLIINLCPQPLCVVV